MVQAFRFSDGDKAKLFILLVVLEPVAVRAGLGCAGEGG